MADLTNKITEPSVKFGFQMNTELFFFFFFSISQMSMGHVYIENWPYRTLSGYLTSNPASLNLHFCLYVLILPLFWGPSALEALDLKCAHMGCASLGAHRLTAPPFGLPRRDDL